MKGNSGEPRVTTERRSGGFLSDIPPAIAALSRSLGRAFLRLLFDCIRIIQALARRAARWLLISYIKVESRLAAQLADGILTIYYVRYLVVIAGVPILLAIAHLWVFLIAYIIFVAAALVMYFRPDDEDAQIATETHSRQRVWLIPIIQWILRLSVAVAGTVFLYLQESGHITRFLGPRRDKVHEQPEADIGSRMISARPHDDIAGRPAQIPSPTLLRQEVRRAVEPASEPNGGLIYVGIGAGEQYTCGVAKNGTGYCWGAERTALGNGKTDGSRTPVGIMGGLTVSMVSAGYYLTCWLTTSGAAHCTGQNGSGQLGNGIARVSTQRGWEYFDSTVPTAVAGGLTFSSVSVGHNHACAVTSDRLVYCWGGNRAKQLGNDKIADKADSPVPVLSAGGMKFATVSAGTAYTCALTTIGEAYCWGAGNRGQLGSGTTKSSEAPVAVAGPRFVAITTSKTQDFACGLTEGGIAYCWGANENHQLGNGRRGNQYIPVEVEGGLTFASLSAGGLHTCGVTTNASAYCWGTGRWGQLGAGSKEDSSIPVAVAGQLKFASISAGSLHTCGITVSGAVFCWGSSGGDVFSRSRTESLAPVRVSEP